MFEPIPVPGSRYQQVGQVSALCSTRGITLFSHSFYYYFLNIAAALNLSVKHLT